jgi:hypothetical protein
MINREIKRAPRLVKKYAKKRAALKAIINDPNASDEEKQAARLKLQKLPRDASSPVRQRNRCGSPAARAVSTASSAWAATSCVRRRCAATCPACARPAGKPPRNAIRR